VLQVPEQRFPCSPWCKPMVKQVVPLQPMEDHAGADIHNELHGGPHARADGHALKEAAAHDVPMLEQAPGRNCSL